MLRDQSQNEEEKRLWERFQENASREKVPCLDDNDFGSYLEGRLSGRRLRVAEEHLAVCSACLDKLIEIRSLLGIEAVEVPEEIKQRVKDLVAEAPSAEREYAVKFTLPPWKLLLKPKESLQWALAFAAVFMACFAGMRLGRDTFLFRTRAVSSILIDVSLNETGSVIDLLGAGGIDII